MAIRDIDYRREKMSKVETTKIKLEFTCKECGRSWGASFRTKEQLDEEFDYRNKCFYCTTRLLEEITDEQKEQAQAR